MPGRLEILKEKGSVRVKEQEGKDYYREREGSKGGSKRFHRRTMLRYNKDLKDDSRQLRRNMTDAEDLLWTRIRIKQLKGYQFYRQKMIDNETVRFYCSQANLMIEVDGGQHYDNEAKKKDSTRDAYVLSVGLRVLRFSDPEFLKNLNGATEKIWENL